MPQGQAGRQVFLDTENVRVVRTAGTRSDVVFVTFEAHQLNPDLERAGFGEKFLSDNGFPAYHFLAKDNFWFQYPEMEEVLAAVRADIAPGTEIVAYSVSMGGYAAIRFSGLLGISRILTFSPQYSIDPKIVPWEKRWDRLFDRPRQILWERLSLPRGVPIILFYDPHNRDRRHVRLLARVADVVRVRVPYAGHASITVLMQSGLLGRVVLDVAENRFDAAAFQRELAAHLDRSPLYREKRARKRGRLFRRLRAALVDRFG
ncbi:alpha/beta hydrolase [Ancylobacter sp.]|uniref:alpha/beta hydrolase n=1 Tax=Ancylobacter sp. TaxID=1872567 RepID=UPI003D0A8FF5